jgi:signal transduction histidine kinase
MCAFETKRSCEVAIEDRLPFGIADRDAMLRVVTNLLSNAAKYSPDDATISVDVTSGDGVVTVSVRDRGPGISRAEQTKLFQKFSRLGSDGSHSQPRGTGLGLFICKSLVEAWGGKIWVESAPGRGSVFSFTAPAADAL